MKRKSKQSCKIIRHDGRRDDDRRDTTRHDGDRRRLRPDAAKFKIQNLAAPRGQILNFEFCKKASSPALPGGGISGAQVGESAVRMRFPLWPF